MPYASYKTFVGVAKDGVNATLSAAIASSATSLPLQNTIGTTGTLTTSGASYSAIIFDGANTEVVACSGNLSAGAITCAATAHAHSANVYIAFQLTASLGPTDYIPVMSFDPADEIAQLVDESMRGYSGKTYGIQPGNRKASWSMEGVVFPDTFGYILGAHFGACTVSGSSAPYTFKFSVNNAGTYQPAHYILYAYNGYNTRVFAGSLVSEFTLSLDPAQLVKYTSKWICRASGVLTTPTQSYSGIVPVPSWAAAMSINSAAVGKITKFDATFSRSETEAVEALTGNQDPYTIFGGVSTCTGKMTVVKEDDSILAYYNGATPLTQPPVAFTLAQGSGSTEVGLNLQLSQAGFKNVVTKYQGSPLVTEEADFEGIMNSTDGSPGTGQAPCQVQLLNAHSSTSQYV